ncbi:PRC-barrel domain-containing protein [Solibacillus sp. FSL H8-0538]|uniref:PRC-barrel domain-containing protein n=1 Tax=Solibacillus sp. FSL H8-0538 TaxID=2921400 RepID=UPI0030F7D474
MRFSTVQEKEIIEATSGKFIGYIIDAEVCEEKGEIIAFIISQPKKFYHLFQGEENTIRIAISHILTVGKDVILVKGINE